MDALIREARLVTLSFFVNDMPLKRQANIFIEKRVELSLAQFSQSASVHEIRARTIDNYFDLGMKYFRRYALTNLAMFMDENSQSRFNYLVEEIALIDTVIAELRQGIKFGMNSLAELGEYLMVHIRLTSVKDSIEKDMIHALEGPGFRQQVLPDIAKVFYDENKKRKMSRTLGTTV